MLRYLVSRLITAPVIATLAFAGAAQSSADVLLTGGKVFTGDPDKPWAHSVAIRGERILGVGSDGEMRKLSAAKTRVIDLNGRTVVPGFNDAHAHFGPTLQGIDLALSAPEPSWAEVLNALKSAAATAPKGKWIFGTVGETVINDPLSTRQALDQVAPSNPVWISTYFGHGAVFNSRAMAELKLNEAIKGPIGGHFDRDPSKRLLGRVYEYAQWGMERSIVESQSDVQLMAELKKRAAEASSYGITSMQIMSILSMERFARLVKEADLPIRVRVIAFPGTTGAHRDLTDTRALNRFRSSNSKLSVQGIKWILDGTPIERGASMLRPYMDRPGWHGQMNFSQAAIEQMVSESLASNQQALFHCSGDRCVKSVMDAMEKVGGNLINWRGKRVRIEHGEGVTGELATRAKRLGIVVVQNPTHFTVVDVINSRWGVDAKFAAQKSLVDVGIPFAVGSDGPINPFLNIMFATIHPLRPGEAISREAAVTAYTYGSAFAEFREDQKGVLRPGMAADMAVLSQDVFTIPTQQLPGIKSVLTILGGQIVHQDRDIQSTKSQ